MEFATQTLQNASLLPRNCFLPLSMPDFQSRGCGTTLPCPCGASLRRGPRAPGCRPFSLLLFHSSRRNGSRTAGESIPLCKLNVVHVPCQPARPTPRTQPQISAAIRTHLDMDHFLRRRRRKGGRSVGKLFPGRRALLSPSFCPIPGPGMVANRIPTAPGAMRPRRVTLRGCRALWEPGRGRLRQKGGDFSGFNSQGLFQQATVPRKLASHL